jgi:tetratricopeptide (TPR) repeat protein
LSPERGTYAFSQNVLRKIAYQTMTKRERRDRHLQVAAHLRRAFPDDGAEVAEVIAAHYQEAFIAMPAHADAETVRSQAIEAFDHAGRRAAEVGAPDSGETAYRTAARLAVRDSDRLRFTAAAGDMAARAGRYEDALVLYEEVVSGHTDAERPERAAELAHGIGHALGRLGRTEESAQRMREALDVLRGHPNGEVEARLHCDLAFFLARPHTDEALEHAEQALALAEALELPEQLGTTLQTKGTILGQRGRVVEAAGLLTAAVGYAQERGLTWPESIARVNLGDLLYQSDMAGAEEHTQAAADLLHRLGDSDEAFALGNLALIEFYAGDWESSRHNAERAMEVAKAQTAETIGSLALAMVLHAQGDRSALRLQLARLTPIAARSEDIQELASHGVVEAASLLLDGRADEALRVATRTVRAAYPVLRFRNDGVRLGWPLALDAALAAGDLDEADHLLAMVTEAPRGHVPPYLWAQLAHYRALTRAARADPTDVETDLQRAIAAMQGLGYPYWTARTQADLGRWLVAHGRPEDAGPLLTESVDTFARLGARGDLERTRPLVSAGPA